MGPCSCAGSFLKIPTLHLCSSFQDGHEICFVGDEAFRELSQVDPKADQLLDEVRYKTVGTS